MKQRKRRYALAAAIMSLIVTVPPSFVATHSHKIVIEIGSTAQWSGSTLQAQLQQMPTVVVQVSR